VLATRFDIHYDGKTNLKTLMLEIITKRVVALKNLVSYFFY